MPGAIYNARERGVQGKGAGGEFVQGADGEAWGRSLLVISSSTAIEIWSTQ